jgi:hypothetical protein
MQDDARKLGTPHQAAADTFVMTNRVAHEAWGELTIAKPRAAALLHVLTAKMGHQNALVVSQKTLAKMLGVTDRTVRTAVKDLVDGKWITTVAINGPGTVCAYVVNDQVVWGQSRDQLHLSIFSAAVIADKADQDPNQEAFELRKIPTLYSNERQLPTGPGLDPPSQPAIGGLEPDLPALSAQRAAEPPMVDIELEDAVSKIERGGD